MSAHPAVRRLARGALAACVAASLLVSTVACASRSSEDGDVLSQKVAEEGRTQVSVLVKYAFTVNGFEQAVEEQFPDIDIVQVGNYTREMGIDEYEARLAHGDLTDIVMTWPYEVGEQYWDDNLLDLSGMGFSSRYNISALNEIARDGKLYYLPGPAQVRGIVYNKTLFAENGWEVPADFDGFVELCRTIEDSGMRSLQLGLKNAEVLDTAFTGFGFASCYGKPQDERWLEAYDRNDGASFGDQFQPALDTFQTLVDENILQAATSTWTTRSARPCCSRAGAPWWRIRCSWRAWARARRAPPTSSRSCRSSTPATAATGHGSTPSATSGWASRSRRRATKPSTTPPCASWTTSARPKARRRSCPTRAPCTRTSPASARPTCPRSTTCATRWSTAATGPSPPWPTPRTRCARGWPAWCAATRRAPR